MHISNKLYFKCFISLLGLFFAIHVSGEIKDRRAKLSIRGWAHGIFVAPDEKIWIESNCDAMCYTRNIDSNWHSPKLPYSSQSEPANLRNVSFFNKDIAIIMGDISADCKGDVKNGYYFTKNGGASWSLLRFDGDERIAEVFVDKTGHAWAGGSSGAIIYSQDYGQHWVRRNSPYTAFTSMKCICMSGASCGFSAPFWDNAIYTTSDNWSSYKKIATPFDQNKYQDRAPFGNHEISKIVLWNRLIVVRQDDHIFYTDTAHLDWKQFPVNIVDFTLDQGTNELYAVCRNRESIVFTNPLKFHLLCHERLRRLPVDIKAVNGSLFVLDNEYEVHKVNARKTINAILYTKDEKITEPNLKKQGVKLAWGAEGNELFIADDGRLDWYRENTLPFTISDLKLLNDSVALLWDGADNYLYTLKSHKAELYYPKDILRKFLVSPITSMGLISYSAGCFHLFESSISYKNASQGILTSSRFRIDNPNKRGSFLFNNKVRASRLTSILANINRNVAATPAIEDFCITEQDKENYLADVNEMFSPKSTDHWRNSRKITKPFYYSVPAILDTLSYSTCAAILHAHRDLSSTTTNRFFLFLENTAGDKLQISSTYYCFPFPWNLHWTFSYQDERFSTYNLDLSKFVKSCIPDEFLQKENFDNRLMIMDIAEYLWDKEHDK